MSHELRYQLEQSRGGPEHPGESQSYLLVMPSLRRVKHWHLPVYLQWYGSHGPQHAGSVTVTARPLQWPQRRRTR